MTGVQTCALPIFSHLTKGAIGIFLYVGAEVTIGSLMVNYLMLPGVAGLPQATAGKMLAFYWGSAMVGRFLGAALLQHIKPGASLQESAH